MYTEPYLAFQRTGLISVSEQRTRRRKYLSSTASHITAPPPHLRLCSRALCSISVLLNVGMMDQHLPYSPESEEQASIHCTAALK